MKSRLSYMFWLIVLFASVGIVSDKERGGGGGGLIHSLIKGKCKRCSYNLRSNHRGNSQRFLKDAHEQTHQSPLLFCS